MVCLGSLTFIWIFCFAFPFPRHVNIHFWWWWGCRCIAVCQSLEGCLCWSSISGEQLHLQFWILSWLSTFCSKTYAQWYCICPGCAVPEQCWYSCRRLEEEMGASNWSWCLCLSLYLVWCWHSFLTMIWWAALREGLLATRCCNAWNGDVWPPASRITY